MLNNVYTGIYIPPVQCTKCNEYVVLFDKINNNILTVVENNVCKIYFRCPKCCSLHFLHESLVQVDDIQPSQKPSRKVLIVGGTGGAGFSELNLIRTKNEDLMGLNLIRDTFRENTDSIELQRGIHITEKPVNLLTQDIDKKITADLLLKNPSLAGRSKLSYAIENFEKLERLMNKLQEDKDSRLIRRKKTRRNKTK